MKDPLPEFLRPLFWDYDLAVLDWETDRDWIVRRVLQTGAWRTTCWLRETWGDQNLHAWLVAHVGGRLSPRRLRYWELILDLPPEDVDQWISQAKNNPWEKRRAGL